MKINGVQASLGSEIKIEELINEDSSPAELSNSSTTKTTKEDETDLVVVDFDDTEVSEKQDLEAFKKIIDSNESLKELVSEIGYEKVFNAIDKDSDGVLSEEEIEAVSKGSKTLSDLTVGEIKKFIKDLEKENEETITKEELEKIKQQLAQEMLQQMAQMQAQQQAQAVGGSSGGGGSYGSSGGGNTTVNNSSNVNPTTPSEADTIEKIEQEIEKQEENKVEVEKNYNEKIEEKEEKIAEIVQESDLSDEIKEEYDSENERLTEEIEAKDSEINENTTLMQDYLAEAQSHATNRAKVETQISSVQSAINSLNPDEDSDKIAQYQANLANLEQEKERLSELEQEAKDNADETEEKIETLKDEKETLIEEKENILETLSEKYTKEKEKIEALQKEVEEHQNDIATLRKDMTSDIQKIDENIQELKLEKAKLIEDEKTNAVLEKNKITVDRTPTALKEDIQNVDWSDYGYNEEFGNKLGEAAQNVTERLKAAGISTESNCLGGVKNSYYQVTGEYPFGAPEQGITVASKCESVMENNEDFREITGISAGDLQYLPAGAIVVWSSSTTGDSPASKYGHISISLGNGYESSSTVVRQYYSVGENGKPRVFIPVG